MLIRESFRDMLDFCMGRKINKSFLTLDMIELLRQLDYLMMHNGYYDMYHHMIRSLERNFDLTPDEAVNMVHKYFDNKYKFTNNESERFFSDYQR